MSTLPDRKCQAICLYNTYADMQLILMTWICRPQKWLISPAFYDILISLLGWVVELVGCMTFRIIWFTYTASTRHAALKAFSSHMGMGESYNPLSVNTIVFFSCFHFRQDYNSCLSICLSGISLRKKKQVYMWKYLALFPPFFSPIISAIFNNLLPSTTPAYFLLINQEETS